MTTNLLTATLQHPVIHLSSVVVLQDFPGPSFLQVVIHTFCNRGYFVCLWSHDLFWSVLLTRYCSGDKIETNEMDGARSAYGGEEKHIQGFGGETWVKETAWETQA